MVSGAALREPSTTKNDRTLSSVAAHHRCRHGSTAGNAAIAASPAIRLSAHQTVRWPHRRSANMLDSSGSVAGYWPRCGVDTSESHGPYRVPRGRSSCPDLPLRRGIRCRGNRTVHMSPVFRGSSMSIADFTTTTDIAETANDLRVKRLKRGTSRRGPRTHHDIARPGE